MKVTEVRYAKRHNIGNYESEEIGLVAVLDDGEKYDKVMAKLKADVAKMRGADATDEETEETDEADQVADETEDTEEADDSDDEQYAKPSKTAKSKTKTKTFKKKAQVYQRGNDVHKELFTTTLATFAPKWRKSSESKALAKELSVMFEGNDFLDEDGNVLKSFKDALKKQWLDEAGK